jgi:peptidyl-Lys metalloendopeptidase
MRIKFRGKIFFAALGILAVLLAWQAFAQVKVAKFDRFELSEKLSSRIEFVRAEFGAAEAVVVRFTLTNMTATVQSVLKWGTPFEGFNGNIFKVTMDGKPVLYTGRVIKRSAPRPEDYLTLNPGEQVSIYLDLARAYDISDRGDYRAEFSSRLLDIGTRRPLVLATERTYAKFLPRSLKSNVATFRLTEKKLRSLKLEAARKEPAKKKEAEAAKAPAFTDCSADQTKILELALCNARRFAAAALREVGGVSKPMIRFTPRFVKWFGAYEADRYATVKDHFAKISDALDTKPITFNAGCAEDCYAFVYPSKPYEIYLCNQFWTAPDTGTDSKLGTLIHEMSHFYVVAGTDDHVYGQTACLSLAETDAVLAADNADSHEYYAEDARAEACTAADIEPAGLELMPLSIAAILATIILYALVRRRRPMVS